MAQGRRLLPLFSFVILFTSCFHTKKVVTKVVTLDTITVSSKNVQTYQASAPRVWEITNTRVALSFNLKEKTADGEACIKMHPYFYGTDTLVLDAKGMKIDTVFLMKPVEKRVKYSYKNDQIKVHFDETYQAGDSIEVCVKYKSMPYAVPTGGSAAITEDRGLYFINTDNKVKNKPVQIWTQGETESNSHWLPTIDKPNTRFTIQIELTVPDSFQTLANGYMAKSTKGKNGLRVDEWKMDLPIQAYAAMFAIGKFDIIKDQWRGKDVNYYVEHEYAPYARKMFNNTPEMMEYFSKITGVEYPWNKYDQVVVRDYVSGAMENTTASLFGEFMNQNAREIADRNYEDIVSHELFHMWFGDYVTCESWSNLTVNESFANYGEQLWRRHKYGDASADQEAYNDLRKYLQYSERSDPQLVRFYYDDREETFDPITYEKGGAVLRYMNTLMGDAAFDKAMKLYLTKNAFHSGEAHQWRLAVEEATGQDWNWYFNEWYYHAGHPVLDVSYKYNDSAQVLKVTVLQQQADSPFKYILPLKAAVLYGNDKTIVDWNIKQKKETFTYAYKNGVRPTVVADCNNVLPGKLTENKKMREWLVEMQDMNDYVNQHKCIGAATWHMNDSGAADIYEIAMNSSMPGIRQYVLDALKTLGNDKWKDKWKSRVEYMAINDTSKNVRAAAYNVLGKWKDAGQKENIIAAISDSSYDIAGAALNALSEIDSVKAYSMARDIVKTRPQGQLMSYTWHLMGDNGAEEDFHYYKEAAPYYYGTKKFQFATGLYSYEEHVKNLITFEQGLMLFRQMAKDENIKSYREGLFYYVIELGKHFNEQKDKEATDRLNMTKEYLNKMTEDEGDPGNAAEYKNMMKIAFPVEVKKNKGGK